MVVEHSVRSSDDRLAIPGRIHGHTDARLNIVRIGLDALLQSKDSVRGKRQSLWGFEFRRNLHVVAHTVIQSDLRTDAPRVLPEGANRNVVEGIAGAADALNEISGQSRTVGLYSR